jgi:hypothetical protein
MSYNDLNGILLFAHFSEMEGYLAEKRPTSDHDLF